MLNHLLRWYSSQRASYDFITAALYVQEIHRKKMDFRQIAGFPEVICVSDETHMRIVVHKEYEAEYINRKIYLSISVQLVLDAKYKIIDSCNVARVCA